MSAKRLHPGAWWLWALALATAASRTTNPWLLVMIVGVAGCVVAACRGDEPWAQSYRVFLRFGLVVIAIRVIFHVLLGGVGGSTILFTVPRVSLPEWATGISLGGPVTGEGLLTAGYNGLALATLLCCLGAANALANPKRLVRAVPIALYEVSVAVAVALSTAPQLVTSIGHIRRARALRGDTRRGLRSLRALLVPVFTDALDRSVWLAAAMDSRGYGRRPVRVSRLAQRATTIVLIVGLLAVCVSAYALLATDIHLVLAMIVLGGGVGLAVAGLWLSSHRAARSRYRPDRWRLRETIVAASGLVTVIGVISAEIAGVPAMNPNTLLLQAPGVPLVPALGVLVALAPVWAAS